MPALIVAGGAALVQAGIGVAQYAKGVKDLKNLTRPEYHIPPEIEKNMTEADLMAYYGMPDAQKAEYQQNIQRTQQAATRGIADRKGGIGSIVAAQQQTQDAYTKMLSMDVQQRMANIQRAQQMRQTMAQYRDKAWQINEMDPYEQNYAEAQSMMGAGMQNVMGGLQSAGSMAMTAMGDPGLMARLQGGNQTTGTPSMDNLAMIHNPNAQNLTNTAFQSPVSARWAAPQPAGYVTPLPYQGQQVQTPQGGMNALWNTQPNPLFSY